MRPTTADETYQVLVDAHVARHAIAFFIERPGRPTPAGSGTLAHFGSIGGVVTCGHVITALRRLAEREPSTNVAITVCGAQSEQLQSIRLSLQQFKMLAMERFGGEDHGIQGPDLGFVALPPNILSPLLAIGSTLDLAAQQGLRDRPIPSEANLVMHLTCGVIAEYAQPPALVFGHPTMEVETLILPSALEPDLPHEGFDRLRLSPFGSIPSSFEGLSGGGIWRVAFGRDSSDNLRLIERRLLGVAYFQTENVQPQGRQIIGHGPMSLYERLLPAIAAMSGGPSDSTGR